MYIKARFFKDAGYSVDGASIFFLRYYTAPEADTPGSKRRFNIGKVNEKFEYAPAYPQYRSDEAAATAKGHKETSRRQAAPMALCDDTHRRASG